MAPRHRDDTDLMSGLAAWWADGHREMADVTIGALERPSGGRSNETVLVTIDWAGGSTPVVVRMPTLVPSFPTYDLRAQSSVQAALREAGVPAASPIAVEEDDKWLGAPFFVMSRVQGRPVDDLPAFDPWLNQAGEEIQRRVHTGFLSVLATVHRIDWGVSSLDQCLRGATGGMAAEIGWWIDYVNWASDGAPEPGLMDLARWCADHVPRSSPPLSLCWGDARVGNVMFDEVGGITGVLDWELASIGPAEMDVAWYLAMDEMAVTFLHKTVPGFLDRSRAVQSYEAQLGRRLEDLAWHEVFALLRAAAISDRQHRNAGPARAKHAGPAEHELLLAHSNVLIDRLQATA